MKKIKKDNIANIMPGEKRRFIAVFSLFISLIVCSCGVVSGIFKAGMDFGIFIVIAILVIIAFFVIRLRGNKNK